MKLTALFDSPAREVTFHYAADYVTLVALKPYAQRGIVFFTHSQAYHGTCSNIPP